MSDFNNKHMTEENSQDSRLIRRAIENEIREAFIDYSMSVIVSRALPDVRDGLKPVHRRILYAMKEAGLVPTRGYKKSATVVGDVLGKYHPHGDAAVYDSLVRMAQDFSLRYPLVDGQGNYGSIDGDSAAAYRYTEARLTGIALEMLADIEKNTVDYVPNFDDRLQEPTVLPNRVPSLLINGATGIAVGMATNVPPHNLREVVDAVVYLMNNPEATIDELMGFIKGPDFPTAGLIYGLDGVREAYHTGRGKIVVRARATIEEKPDGRGEQIVVTEIPYMVNKAKLVEQIASLVREKRIEGVSALRDESDREGIRVVIELKRDAIPHVVLNQLYKHTSMQTTFGAILLALAGGTPKIMNLKEILQHFIDHRVDVVVRRTQFDLDKALAREHILEGLRIAVDNIDEVVQIIRESKSTEDANARLRERFSLTEVQAKAILDMRLAKLTGLEIDQLQEELDALRSTIAELREILSSPARQMEVIKNELAEVAARHGDERRTEILPVSADLSIEDLIPNEPMVIAVSHTGYIKRTHADTYRSQRRGGRGVSGMDTKDADWVEHVFSANAHDQLLFFTRQGQCYQLKVHEIPQGGRQSRGKPIVNLLNIGADEQIAAVVPVQEMSENSNLLFATRNGVLKKTRLSAYANVRSSGIIGIVIDEGDELIDVRVINGQDDVILATRDGLAIRFQSSDVRETGRATRGVRGISLKPGDAVVGMVIPSGDTTVLVVTERGMGKRTRVDEYRLQRRGGQGVINLRVSEKTGPVVAVKEVHEDDEMFLMTRKGVIIRQKARGIRVIGRATQGVRLLNLDSGDMLVDVARVVESEYSEEEAEDQV